MPSVQIVSAMRVGLETLRANPMRTILSILGVIMGVASLVVVLAIGDGVERYARDQIEQTTDLQTVVLQPKLVEEIDGMPVRRSGGYPVFTLGDADALARALGAAAQVAPMLEGQARATIPGQPRPKLAQVIATGPAVAGRATLAAGRVFTDAELRDSARVAVISAGLAKLLTGPSAQEALQGSLQAALGREVRLEGTAFRVVGVLAPPKGEEIFARVAVPFTTANSAFAPSPVTRVPLLYAQAVTVEQVPAVRQRAEQWAQARLGAGWRAQVQVQSGGGQQRLAQAQQGILVFKLVMGSFAAIALLVGGIGIMNVLIASVVERTREIGIRKATGARHRDILVQFLSEAVAISGVGAALGAALGIAGAFGVTALIRELSRAKVYAAFTWGTLAVAATVSVLVGLAAGMYPALRAARLSPIDAMRHE